MIAGLAVYAMAWWLAFIIWGVAQALGALFDATHAGIMWFVRTLRRTERAPSAPIARVVVR